MNITKKLLRDEAEKNHHLPGFEAHPTDATPKERRRSEMLISLGVCVCKEPVPVPVVSTDGRVIAKQCSKCLRHIGLPVCQKCGQEFVRVDAHQAYYKNRGRPCNSKGA